MDAPDGRGILFPERLPTFTRVPAPESLHGLVRWCWLPRWDLPAGVVSRQEVLPFPASNLVVEPGGVRLHGPSTRASHRDLTGSGWAVGLLLRPAAWTSLPGGPAAVRDTSVPLDEPDLLATVTAAMAAGADDEAVAVATGWANERLAPPDEGGLLADAFEDLVAGDRDVVRVDQAAERLGLTVRAVQRLARRYIGVAPLAVIRRYRLQEAAQRLREDPSVTIAAVAAGLGYADQAHLSADFRQVLGLAPRDYRRAAGAATSRGASKTP
ncbi:AraC family transcriptional regulator [Cellulomonas triticagri]|uniref:AraC family transcriptional regulator n=1 Tax=Cellulomonas triticagri TaxID=2483352 RepID=A0A3M2JLJ5_9CELL|nr:AraC family transcriptional regulator [Cellulomonas triticagri]